MPNLPSSNSKNYKDPARKAGLLPVQIEKQKEKARERDKQRPSAAERGYDKRWAEFRLSYLKDHPLCNRCGSEACKRCRKIREANETQCKRCGDHRFLPAIAWPAEIVHHIKRLTEGGDKYDLDNLESICRSCHAKETNFSNTKDGWTPKKIKEE